MRKNTFIKKKGVIPDNMPFKKGDIVTYVRYEEGEIKQRDVLLFNCLDGDTIKAEAALITTQSWGTLRTEALSRKWEDGGRLRYALSYEMRAMINAFAKR